MAVWLLLKTKKLWLWISIAALVSAIALLILFLTSLPDVSGLMNQNPKNTALMRIRMGQAENRGDAYSIEQEWVFFESIPQLLKDTVRIAEDAGFYWHRGIDYEELKEAIKKNIQEKKFARGASTITQQLAKNLYLSTKKSLVRKIKEYLLARKLEKNLTKDRIFELYLNVIELGRGIFGVQAAALRYFGKPVNELTLEETVRLVAILPRPLVTDPRGDSPWLKWRCRWLLHKLRLYEYISEETYQEVVKIFGEASV